MLQLNNRTPFKCSLGLFPDPDGVDCAYGAIKATFHFEKAVTLASEQQPLAAKDEFWGEPHCSSLKQAGEIGLSRPSTEILMIGHAYAPDGEGTSADVRLKVGSLEKRVRVFGDRVWDGGLFGLRISPPQPFQRLPLKYELAFGGTHIEPGGPEKTEFEARNPVGRGLVARKSKEPRRGIALPNLEDPTQLIKSPRDRPVPAGFGPLCSHWEPRRSHAGTYDAAWLKKRAPYLPADFNPRFLQAAPADLVAPGFLKGGEIVEIAGATPGDPLRFTLPQCSLSVVFHFDGKPHVKTPNLEIVTFEPDENRFTLVWRAAHTIDKKPHALSELEVRCREFPLSVAR